MERFTFEVEGFVTSDELQADGRHLVTLEGQSVAAESEESWIVMLSFFRPRMSRRPSRKGT